MTRRTSVEGYLLTDLRGELDAPIKACIAEDKRCQHAGVHDGHYLYCAAQDAQNKHAGPGEYAYPWAGAGKHLPGGPYPNTECPYVQAGAPPAVIEVGVSQGA